MHKHRNKDMFEAATELRRSSAAEPHANKSRYNRKVKHRGRAFDDRWAVA